MRHHAITRLLAALVGCVALVDCNVDATINIDADIDAKTTVNVDDVKAGQPVPIELNAQNVFLIEPNMTPPPDKARDAAHFRIYFDDFDREPLLITAQTKVEVKVPTDAKEGDHKIKCRLHKHDGTPTTVVSEISIKVKTTITTDAQP